MIDSSVIEKMIKEVMSNLSQEGSYTMTKSDNKATVTSKDYPLSEKVPERIKTPTGKTLDDLKIDGIMNGSLTSQDFKISPDTLEMQAQVAESVGRYNFAQNLRRASELIAVPDERILAIYNALRPYRSTKGELLAVAEELETKYGCKTNVAFIREATALYEQRGRLKE